MKLALIRRQFSATGGAELYLQRLLGALAQGGHELHLFAESWEQKPDNVAMHPVPVSGSRAKRARAFAQNLDRMLQREKFDCVFSLERTLRQDVYRAGDGVHRTWLERRREFAPWWRKPFIGVGSFHATMLVLEAETFNRRNTGRIIVNSEMVKREILKHFAFPEERIHLVRNGVDVARFQTGKRQETRARFGVKDDEYLLLFVGSGWERKGLKYVMGALQLLENSAKVKLLVVGKGRQPSPASPNVIFTGSMIDVENAYAAADLFVFLPIYEPSANVVYEALAAELPVITSVQNGAGELIQSDVNGTVVSDPSDVAAVARIIRRWQTKKTRVAGNNNVALDLKRNVAETLAVLELAAREK